MLGGYIYPLMDKIIISYPTIKLYMNIELLEKQSKFNADINAIIDTIAPFIIDRKITKREIDKANNALINKFGLFTRGQYTSPLYTIWKNDNYGLFRIVIATSDRYININKGDYSTSSYIPSDTKEIYCDSNTGKISIEELKKCYNTAKERPTKKEIQNSFNKWEKLNAKIRELENKKSELVFHYYFKD